MGARKRKDFFEDFGIELFENIEGIIEALMEELGESAPFVYGFSIIHQPGEDPEIREFGNISERSVEEKEVFSPEEKSSFIDVFETEDEVHVIADFPELEKEDIKLHATGKALEIVSLCLSENQSEYVELPVTVIPESARATYKNGVLEVVFSRASEEEPVEIKIE